MTSNVIRDAFKNIIEHADILEKFQAEDLENILSKFQAENLEENNSEDVAENNSKPTMDSQNITIKAKPISITKVPCRRCGVVDEYAEADEDGKCLCWKCNDSTWK